MKQFLILFISLLFFQISRAQQVDTTDQPVKTIVSSKEKAKKDTALKTPEPHSPRKATIRSAMLPGWGQIYNEKYWKLPIVYGALGTCVGFFIYNRSEYIDARDAYRNKLDNDPSNDGLIKPKFRPVDPESIRRYRNDVRQYVDYSVLAFLVCWGLNVVDATVDGHLKEFEVSENLSLQIKPSYLPQTRQASMGFVFTFGTKKQGAGR